MGMQTKLQSHVEAAVDTAISFSVGVTTNYFVLPLMGFPVHLSDAAALTVVFIGMSYIRRYFVRRLFNQLCT
jgi:hypothetical protein